MERERDGRHSVRMFGRLLVLMATDMVLKLMFSPDSINKNNNLPRRARELLVYLCLNL